MQMGVCVLLRMEITRLQFPVAHSTVGTEPSYAALQVEASHNSTLTRLYPVSAIRVRPRTHTLYFTECSHACCNIQRCWFEIRERESGARSFLDRCRRPPKYPFFPPRILTGRNGDQLEFNARLQPTSQAVVPSRVVTFSRYFRIPSR